LANNGVYYKKPIIYKDFRPGDVRHSQADISKALRLLNYEPKFDVKSGIERAMTWYIMFFENVKPDYLLEEKKLGF